MTSAQFLIDSESNLKSSITRINQPSKQQITNPASQSSVQEWIGMGLVKSIDLNKREIILDHKSIPAINMPAMTMGFHVVPSIDLTSIKSGDEIHFVLIKNSDGQYHITKIHVMKHRKVDPHKGKVQ